MKFLKFSSEAECIEAFEPFMQEGNCPGYIGTSAVDVVGEIWKPTDKTTTDSEGNVMPVMKKLSGWHVNLSGDCPAELQAFLIDAPATPNRVFA